MKTIGESEFLYEYLENKNVVVVGNADYLYYGALKSTELGKFIDSHDVIVRVNYCSSPGIPEKLIKPNREKYIGSKANLLYMDRGTPRHFVSQNKMQDFVERGGECIFWRRTLDDVDANNEVIRKQIRKYISIVHISYAFRNQHLLNSYRYNKRRYQTTTGLVAISHLLLHPLKTLNVIGFSCYSLNVDNDSKGIKNYELNFMSNVVDSDNRVQIDDVLSQILSC